MHIVYCVGEKVQVCNSSKAAFDVARAYLSCYFGYEKLGELEESYERDSNDFGVMGYVWVQKLKVGDKI